MNTTTNKKILYIITKSNFGGAGKYVYDLSTNAKENGYEVVVACGGEGLLTEKLDSQNIRTIIVPNLERDLSILKEFKVLSSLRSIYKGEKPDIVHLNSSKIGGIGALAGRLEKVPKIIFTAHGWAFNENRNVIWKIFMYTASWFTILLSNTVITISLKEERQALAFPFVSTKKARMIYNGVGNIDFEEKESARSLIEKITGIILPTDTTIIGTIGELHTNKGYMYALKMCKQLIERNRKFLYLIIGEGEQRNKLETYIRKEGLERHVKLLGAIPDAATSSTLLKAFDIFLLPSTKEGLPYVLLEAGLAEVPVLATRVGGIPELIEHEKTGLLSTPKNEGALTIQIEKILYDEQLRQDFSKSYSEVVRQNFNKNLMLESIFSEYRN